MEKGERERQLTRWQVDVAYTCHSPSKNLNLKRRRNRRL
jgi:hypothetical protein